MLMEMTDALDTARDALLIALSTSAPILLMGLAVGLIISILQSVTQLQEQTLSFVPKIVAMMMAAGIFIPWIAARMLAYTQEMIGTVP